ncbi:MAG: hypothetical protein JXR53_15435 [Bacteroidales bacterium]|nr:hypothetical protein [Bacteroidales bacterium]
MNFLVLAILLMLLLYYYSYWIKIYIIIITFLVFIDAWFLESRAMMIRIPLFLICLTAIIIYRKLKSRSVLFLSFVVVFLPFIWFYTSINDNQSLFARYSEEVFNTQDNRTFLYTEVFDDLLKTKTIIQGKGASGTYYSPTMRIAKVDSKNRPNVEVGILAILLKGGIIAVFLTSILIIYAIYLAFFKTNNIYTIAIGYLLLIHFVILFVENLVQFNTYNFLIWYFIGICLNGQVREMTDQEIFNLVKYGEPA